MELKHIANRAGRLSSFLLGELGMSASLMNKLKWGDSLKVNGTPQRTNYGIAPGDVITVQLDERDPEYPVEHGELAVLYEDDYLLAVDKPAGMLIHPSRSCFHGTLANLVAGYYARTGQKSAFHPMTRLDRDTFGVVLLAKNAHVHTRLQQVSVEKHYRALVYGGPKEDFGTIDAPIARKPLPSLLREIREDGKYSITRFRVIDRKEQVTVLDLEPVTGRTHQLRLHCAYMGYPILGDPQYGSEESQNFSENMGLTSQQLCARELIFFHPITGVKIHLISGMDI